MLRSETLVSFVRKDFDYYRIILLPALILFIVLSFMLLQVVHDLRINEVGITLQKASHDDESSSALLLERFRMLIKESGKGETAEAYLRESKLMALMSDVRIMPARTTRIAWLETPAIFLINLMAFLTASDYYYAGSDVEREKLIQIAYIYERRRSYKEALVIYTRLLFDRKRLSAGELSYILLHRAFCLSLAGNRGGALGDLNDIIAENRVPGNVQTARKMAGFLQGIDERKKKIDALPLSEKKGENYFQIMAYTDAINTLNMLEQKGKSQALYFYRGRSYEESGLTAEALRDYRKVIQLNQSSSYAKSANRRIYLLGSFYVKDNKIKEEAEVNASSQGDKGFIKSAGTIENAMSTTKEDVVLAQKDTVKALEEIRQEIKLTDSPVNEIQPSKSEPTPEPIPAPAAPIPVVESKEKIVQPKKAELKKLPSESELLAQSPGDLKITFKKSLRTLDRLTTKSVGKVTGHILHKTPDKTEILTLYGKLSINNDDIIKSEKIPVKEAIR